MAGDLPSKQAREIACTFCGSGRVQAGTIIAGPDGYICDGCVSLADSALSGAAAGNAALELGVVPAGANTHCAFCGKERGRVAGMASAGRITICDECVGLCQEIISEQRGTG